MIGSQIAAEAETWVDTPFLWQASVKGVGADCKGLIAGVARNCGRPEGSTVEALCGDYRDKVDPVRLRAGLKRLFERVCDRRPGDILLIRMGGKAQHLAIAAPTEAQPNRAIEAMPTGPARVRPINILPHRVDSIWRWYAD